MTMKVSNWPPASEFPSRFSTFPDAVNPNFTAVNATAQKLLQIFRIPLYTRKYDSKKCLLVTAKIAFSNLNVSKYPAT